MFGTNRLYETHLELIKIVLKISGHVLIQNEVVEHQGHHLDPLSSFITSINYRCEQVLFEYVCGS